MRRLISILLLCLPLYGSAQSMTMVEPYSFYKPSIVVIQINAEWNEYNTRRDLQKLRGCEYRFGLLSNQPEHIQKSISAVPLVVVYKDGQVAYQFAADLSFQLGTPFEEIQKIVWELRQ